MVDQNKLVNACLVSLIEASGKETLTLTDEQIEQVANEKYVEVYRNFENTTYTISIRRFDADKE
jgi:hypothetical protein